jgi:pimeloyl-ACP methyl ester carboxylesterase
VRAVLPRIVVLAVAGLALVAASPAAAKKGQKLNPERLTPMIFVHGGSGSAAQFESQQQRLTSNGYPQRFIKALEYDTLTPISENIDEVHADLDALIAKTMRKTGKSRVDVLGHSRGTTVMHGYLEDPERAANVRRYVNIDGRTADSPPGGVRTLAIWAGRGTEGREIGGAKNVTIPNQTHVEVATSPESFGEIFRFLIGKEPKTSRIKKGKKWLKISGRAVVFPENVGVPADNRLKIWRLQRRTGEHKRRKPFKRPDLSADGSWGPVKLRRGKRYEFELRRPDGTSHHLYPEPFRRNNRLVRLLSSVPGAGIELLLTQRSDDTTGFVVSRYKEFWGDQGGESDALFINGRNVINAATSPIDNRTNGIFVLDDGLDGMSDLSAPVEPFFSISFLTGVDFHIPATSPPDETVKVALRSRGSGPKRRLNVPNFASSDHRVSLIFSDHEQW